MNEFQYFMASISENTFRIKFAAPSWKSHNSNDKKKKKKRCGPGINFPFLVKISFISNFLKYTEYKICILV